MFNCHLQHPFVLDSIGIIGLVHKNPGNGFDRVQRIHNKKFLN